MKITLKNLFPVMALASLFLLSSCGGDDPATPSVPDQQLAKLSSQWKLSDVTLDGTSKKTDYAAFTLTISGTAGADSFGYTTAGRPSNSPWPPSGTWVFGTNPESQIVRDTGADKLDMTYSVSDSQLQLTFDFSGTGYPGRVSAVKGKWVFTFTK